MLAQELMLSVPWQMMSREIASGAHAALVLDGAGYHLAVSLPPCARKRLGMSARQQIRDHPFDYKPAGAAGSGQDARRSGP